MNLESGEGCADVDLLAECGQIAQRLRGLERTWSIDLKDLQKKTVQSYARPALPTTHSVNQKLDEIFDNNEHSTTSDENNDDVNDPKTVNRLKYLEDTVIKIHHRQELQSGGPTASNKAVPIRSNMNYSAVTKTHSNNNDLTTPPYAIHEEDQLSCTSAGDSGCRDNNNKSLINDNADDTDSLNLDCRNRQNVHQQHMCANIQNDDLRMLIRELKRKVDFTEKMNWLSLSNRPFPPPQRKTSLPKHSDVKKQFLEICDTTLSEDVKMALRLPSFDSYDFEDYEVLHLLKTMFVELSFLEKFHISPVRLREWLYEVYKHYNDVPFHNFRHCFCVSQMMYAITWQTNLISRLGDMDVFILLISCICHDLDHPGYNNVYQINAKTELALRYNDISPLENHHCSIAFRLLEFPDCNLLENTTIDMYKEIREGIIRCILATDMARHNDILTQFREILPIFDYKNNSHKNLLCMVLIKVADISNEARPLDVAEPWLDRLLEEFFAQSAAEKLEGLPVTPFMDPDKVSKPGSQVRFIGLVLLPLFESLGELLPELIDFIIVPVRFALDFYKRLNEAAQKNRKSLAETEGSSDGDEIIPRSQSGISVRSRRSIPSQKSNSKNSVDEEQMLIAAELHDLPEGSESGDSETATEVDVAEKTSKFKVDTESRNKLNTQMVHRKGHHRDKRPSMVSEMGSRARGSYGNLQHNYNSRTNTFGSNRAISLDHYNHRRMSDGIQTVTSDSTVYYHQRTNEQDTLLRTAPSKKSSSSSCQGSTEVKLLVSEDPTGKGTSNATIDENDDQNRVQLNNNCSVASKNLKSKLTSSVSCSNSPKSIISRLRQLTGRLSFSFDKESRRLSNGAQTIMKTSPTPLNSTSKNNNVIPNICCSAKGAVEGRAMKSADPTSRNRAFSLDVPATRYYNSSGASSNDGSRKSLSSNKNDEADDSADNSSSVFGTKKLSGEVDASDI